MFPKYSRRSVYRHAAKAFDSVEGDTRKLNPGQPRKLNDRDERDIAREIRKSFTTKHLKVTAGIDERIFDGILCRTLKKSGYGYYHSREKTFENKRFQGPQGVCSPHKKTLEEKIWTKGIAFYFNRASFQHKYNPFDEAKSTRTSLEKKT